MIYVLRLTLSVLAVGTLAVAGCTIRHAAPLAEKPEALCIQRNPAVIVPNFLPILQESLQRHGVQTKVVSDTTDCSLVLSYDARQGWDLENFVRLSNCKSLVRTVRWWAVRGGSIETASDSTSTHRPKPRLTGR